jgi:hypothetical protein
MAVYRRHKCLLHPEKGYSNYGWKDFLRSGGCGLAEEAGAGGNFGSAARRARVGLAARIAGRAGFAGLTLIVFSPLLAGFFLALGRIFRDLEQGFHALFKVLLGLLSFVIFVFFGHRIPRLRLN